MNVSFAEIQAYVQGFIGDDHTDTLAVIKREINKEYRRLARERDWPELTARVRESLSATTGQAYLALPGDCAQLISISDTTNDYSYRNIALRNLEEDFVATSSSNGKICFYSILGDLPIKRPLSTDDTIDFTPSAALAAEADIRIRGITNSPDLMEVQDNITTSTTVAQTTAETFRAGWSVHSIGTNGSVDKYITVTETTSGNVLAHIPEGFSFSRYHVIQFENPPDTSPALSIVYKRRVSELVDDDDIIIVNSMIDALQEAVVARMRMWDRKYDQAGVHIGGSRNELSAIFSEREVQGGRMHQMRPDFSGRARRGGF